MQVSGVRLKKKWKLHICHIKWETCGGQQRSTAAAWIETTRAAIVAIEATHKKKRKEEQGANLASEGVAPVSACRCLPASCCVITRSNRPLPAPYDLQSALCFN